MMADIKMIKGEITSIRQTLEKKKELEEAVFVPNKIRVRRRPILVIRSVTNEVRAQSMFVKFVCVGGGGVGRT